MGKIRRWSVEEEDYLKEKVGKMSFHSIAKKLNRTVLAIEVRVRRLGIDNTKFESGNLTANELANSLKADSHTVYNWIQNHGLKASHKVTRQVARFYLIDINDFWKWAENNKEKINFYKIDPLLLLPEPDWVENERKKDFYAPKRQKYKWSKEEDERLISLMKANYTQIQIGEMMNRSEKGVQRRISRLREQGVIPKQKITLRWSRKEIRMLLELESQGLSDEQIAYELGREREHIVDKRRTMRKYGNYKGRKMRIG